jgi:hypothetical protein
MASLSMLTELTSTFAAKAQEFFCRPFRSGFSHQSEQSRASRLESFRQFSHEPVVDSDILEGGGRKAVPLLCITQ